VAEQEQVRICVGTQARDFCAVSAVSHFRTENASRAFEFELLVAGAAEEVGDRQIVGEPVQPVVSTFCAESLLFDPAFRQNARGLRLALIGYLRFSEPQ
jgi:hypothetical protein